MKTIFVSAAALVAADGRILLASRPRGKDMEGLWEFPGGKVEAGETPETALIRELQEELGIAVTAENLTPFTFTTHAYPEKFIVLMLYLCHDWQHTPTPLEHQSLIWKHPGEMDALAMPPADEPLVSMLKSWNR